MFKELINWHWLKEGFIIDKPGKFQEEVDKTRLN